MRSRAAWTAAAALSLLALAAVVVRVAWISDDAYITLRTVENWLAGHGPVWNPGERVQTFTHPLWLLLLTAVRAATGECYFTVLAVSALLSGGAVWLLLRLGQGPAGWTAVTAMLLGSHAFVEYATSGLENPLVYLLLALLVHAATAETGPERRLGRVALLVGLLVTTRLDLLLLGAPVLFAAVRAVSPSAAGLRLLLGLLPAAAWLLFAALYYGSMFPITAFAKAFAPGVPAGDLALQGLRYFWFAATTDPVTVAVLAAGLGLGLWRAQLRCRALAIGALLYCAYVVKVGGDFMAGRFLTPPLVVAVAITARALATRGPGWHLGAAAAALGLLGAPGLPHWLRAPGADPPPTESWNGILDECRFYHPGLGLLSPARDVPAAGLYSRAMRALGRPQRQVMAWGQVGRFAYEAGDLVHVVDPWLCDPLLMRLPVPDPRQWRIGHFIRAVPEGYLETVAHGGNRVLHPGLRRCYETLRTVITGPVFDAERLRAVARLWFGDHDDDLAAYVATDYRAPPRVTVPAGELDPAVPAGTPWFADARVRVVGRGGLRVTLPAPATARRLAVLVQPQARYELRLCRGDVVAATLTIDAAAAQRFQDLESIAARADGLLQRFPELFASRNCVALLLNGVLGLQALGADVPPEAGAFDAILVDAPDLPAHQVAALGGLVLVR
jgi:arabinofuranosyltransferase